MCLCVCVCVCVAYVPGYIRCFIVCTFGYVFEKVRLNTVFVVSTGHQKKISKENQAVLKAQILAMEVSLKER